MNIRYNKTAPGRQQPHGDASTLAGSVFSSIGAEMLYAGTNTIKRVLVPVPAQPY